MFLDVLALGTVGCDLLDLLHHDLAQFVGHLLVGVERNGHAVSLAGDVLRRTLDAHAVGSALLLADRNEVARIERLRQERQGHFVFERVGHLTREMVVDRDLRLLHRSRELLRNLAFHRIGLVVDVIDRFAGGGDRTDVFLHEGFQRFGVDVAHEREDESVGSGVELGVNAGQLFEVELVDDLRRDHLTAGIVAVGHVGHLLLHQEVGIRLGIGELGEEHLREIVHVVLVEPGLREIEVEQLEHRLDVLGRADAAHGAGVVLHRGLHRGRFARKLFLEFRGREFADTRHRVHGGHHFAHVVLLVREQRQAALADYAQAHFVGLEGRGFHDDLRAVGQRPLRRSEHFVHGRLLHGRAFEHGPFCDQRFLDHVVLIGRDLRCGHLVADGENLLGGGRCDALLLGSVDHDHLIRRENGLLREGVDGIHVEHLDQHAVELPFGLGIGHRLVFLVVVQIGLHEFVVAAVVAVGVRAFGLTHQVLLGAFELALRESVAAHLLHFGIEGLEAAGQLAVLGHGHEYRGVERRDDADHVARAHAGAEERRVGLHGDLLQAGVLHRGHVGLDHVVGLGQHRVGELFGKRRALDEELHLRTLHFGIGVDADDRLLVVGNLDGLLLRCAGGGSRNVGHQRLDLGLNGVYVDVTDHDYGLVVRTVPLFVEILQLLVPEVLQPVEVADQVAALVFRAFAQRLQQLHRRTPRRAVARAQLLHDHAALRVDFRRLQRDEVRPVVQDQQRRVDDSFARGRHVLHVVARVIPARAGIEVGAEFHAHGLQILRELFAREVLGSVEGHVFQEVGEALLRIVLLDGSHIVEDVEISLAFRLFVVADVVGHSVFQFPGADLRIGRDRLVHLCRGAAGGERRDGQHQ